MDSTTLAIRDFSTCCRLCLADTNADLKSVFDHDDCSLPSHISAALAIKIQSNDQLTTLVCNPCAEKIRSWQAYKVQCADNQRKLEQWLASTSNTLADISIVIKEEPINTIELPSPSPDVVYINGEIRVKTETLEDDYDDDLPPTLSPQQKLPEAVVPQQNGVHEEFDAMRQCFVCNKVLSSRSNCRKHERTIHGMERAGDDSDAPPSGTRAGSPNMAESTDNANKIQFAAGLKLLQRDSHPPIALEDLSKPELSYIEKCKAMVQMQETRICACHNVPHVTVKRLLAHLRGQNNWFPVFTCFSCMTQLVDRSTATRHYLKCSKTKLEALVRLSNMKKRSEVKVRLYQNYQCKKCKFYFWFHEDYCKHVDEEHSHSLVCVCGQVFDTLDSYRDHVYVSCMIKYHCDLCKTAANSLDEFLAHCVQKHDASDGFALKQDDNYRQRRKHRSLPAKRTAEVLAESSLDEEEVVPAKRRRRTINPPIVEPDDELEAAKVVNPYGEKIPGITCPICKRDYSSNNNMWRHYKNHFEVKQAPNDEDLYACPDCKGMFNAAEWHKHKDTHSKKTCNECGKVFQFQSELDQHRSVHLNIKLYRDAKTQAYKKETFMCEVCDRSFASKDEVLQHKVEHENVVVKQEKKYECGSCNKSYASYNGLYDHKKRKHPNDNRPRVPKPGEYCKLCDYCDRIFITSSSYNLHRQKHERENAAKIRTGKEKKKEEEEEEIDEDEESYHTCKKCFKVFSLPSTLKNHMRSHGITSSPKKSPKKAWCHVCHEAFDSSAALERHKLKGHGEIDDDDDEMPNLVMEVVETKGADLKVFQCDVCVQTFGSKAGLKKHKLKHAKEKVYCKLCKSGFDAAAKLQEHMKERHADAAKRAYKCKQCDKSFSTGAALSSHTGWHQRQTELLTTVKEEVFKCRTCGLSLRSDMALQIHILEKHRNIDAIVVQTLRCTKCNLDFSSQTDYDKHRRFHQIVKDKEATKQKTFPCQACPAAFAKQDMLRLHVRQFHGAPPPAVASGGEYKCTQCNRVFDKANSLHIHLKVHEKQKQMANGGGGEGRSGQGGGLKKFSCSICSKGFELPKDLRTHTIQEHPF